MTEDTMTCVGKDSTEDVKQAFAHAIALAGLKVHSMQILKVEGVPGWIVVAMANPDGWPHECPVLEMHALVDMTGKTRTVEISCCATDQDPLANVLVAPTLRGCACRVEDLAATLQTVWQERQAVIDRSTHGDPSPRFVGQWMWEAPEDLVCA